MCNGQLPRPKKGEEKVFSGTCEPSRSNSFFLSAVRSVVRQQPNKNVFFPRSCEGKDSQHPGSHQVEWSGYLLPVQLRLQLGDLPASLDFVRCDRNSSHRSDCAAIDKLMLESRSTGGGRRKPRPCARGCCVFFLSPKPTGCPPVPERAHGSAWLRLLTPAHLPPASWCTP